MKQIVLGTAGHIDHGKTSLIKALSGIDTDRLKEEKERGITIELGFAHLELPGGRLIGIVDVPGHEKFVKNMVAGATGIDLVALVIAADEGVMPQTREHLEICELLKIRHGVVVLTKIDMVDEEWLELVREDVREYLSETFLADAPIVEVSSQTGEGLDRLLKVLEEQVLKIPEREMGHLFRLPIDRVFSMKGFGTVVTGTTISGSIRLGDEVTIYPQGIDSKIRGIQVHNKEVEEVRAGLRTAVNLQGVEKASIERGNVLATRNGLRPTFMVDVELNLLSSASRKLKNRAKARFHTGTSEIISTVVLLDRDLLEPGSSCYAQIRLDAPTAVLKGDHYVLRSYSPVRTIGGGEILNALPGKKKRFSEAPLAELKKLHTGDLSEVAEVFVRLGRFKGVEEGELPFLANTGRKKIDECLKALKAQKRVVQYDRERGLLIHADFYQRAREELLQTLERYHRDFPLKTGLMKEELRSRTVGSEQPRLFQFLMAQLTAEGRVVQEKEVVRLAEHRVALAEDQEKVRRDLEELYLKGGLQPPYFKEVKEQFPGKTAEEVLNVMVQEGLLVKVKEDLFFHRKVMEDLEARLIEFLREHGEITTPQFKDMTDASRKYTIPLIEYFDRTQVTVRVGDSRVLRKR
ncbi:selenocysteine-specific translation elongation factor [Desulfatiglans anilini]|uniref:selenocysteine-specific translation elongation factor n=1 Tax=Desulfatiglans anilini TaxID=90728 RepID=UPI0004248206|nr:selenocysteine-specific translation elongation factor [Desulfatiglans anilini]